MRPGPPSSAGMTETAFAPTAVIEPIGLDDLHTDNGGENDLRETIAGLDGQRLAAKVNHDHAKLAAIVGVDGTRRVDQGQTFAEGAATARTHLTLVADRDFNRDSGRDGGALQRLPESDRRQRPPSNRFRLHDRYGSAAVAAYSREDVEFLPGASLSKQITAYSPRDERTKHVTIFGYSKLEFNYAAQPGAFETLRRSLSVS